MKIKAYFREAYKYTFYWILGFLAISFAVHSTIKLLRLENIVGENNKTLTMFQKDINKQISNRMDALKYLSENIQLKDLTSGDIKAGSEEITIILNNTKDLLSASIVYVMDKAGTVVGSSNYNGESLMFKNYKFRPYFKEAIKGDFYIYPALGVTTNKRGLYLSSPIYNRNNVDINGVLVIKISLERIDRLMTKQINPAFLISPDGVIFSSNKKEWLFHTVEPLSEKKINEIKKDKQFAFRELIPLNVDLLRDEITLNNIKYKSNSTAIGIPGWRLLVLHRLDNLTLTPIQNKIMILIYITLIMFHSIIVLLFKNISIRKKTEKKLSAYQDDLELLVKKRTKELEESIHKLKETQEQLIQSEKMASLGYLVGGVAHEVNTPIGTTYCLSTNLESKHKIFLSSYQKGQVSKTDFENFLSDLGESIKLMNSNLLRATDLIRNFKKIAVNQSVEETKKINLKDYIEELIDSLSITWRESDIIFKLDIDEDIVINSYPGAFAQIFTNLIINSIKHGFENKKEGEINIKAKKNEKMLKIEYSDNGVGINEINRKKVFDPFFTTRRSQGGSGLGMNIVYNLVVSKLNGSITCSSALGVGTCFNIKLNISDKTDE